MSAGGKRLMSAKSKRLAFFSHQPCSNSFLSRCNSLLSRCNSFSPDRTTKELKSPAPSDPSCPATLFHRRRRRRAPDQLQSPTQSTGPAPLQTTSFLRFRRLLPTSSDFTDEVLLVVGLLQDDADPMVSLMKVEKAPLESHADIGGLVAHTQLFSADVKKQTVFLLQTADVWTTSSSTEL
ncbi:hypothetical protein LXL04_000183 [Taraxacum kok-saghyz]